ncbi:MAG: (Fe-S)-binding protein [Armatimonadota bacterium]|nr:(Fe-S)-binding protein [Armatimonadota bacterium]MDR7445267.1 (Fe-S)-binding protein [Armatimonadota bacterium]MDR7570132.1 (Fe-S)-binding protein [Armatimonadota bacterium]MDR7614734.1 (Fe-S)-binding protein [Armatimonadota bacterium]
MGQTWQVENPARVALFVTCLVDQFFPEVGEATVAVLERVGVEVAFPEAQTCCGQVLLNDGFREEAAALARRFVEIFAPYEAVVAPSGSCVAVVREFYPQLLRGTALEGQARQVARRTYELSEFLVRVLGVTRLGARLRGRVTYHPSCHLLRGLGAAACAEQLVRNVEGLEFVPLREPGACCGFGGVFSVKFGALSEAILLDKLADLEATGAQAVVSTDVGCLMHLRGVLQRRKSPIRTLHLAELLNAREP